MVITPINQLELAIYRIFKQLHVGTSYTDISYLLHFYVWRLEFIITYKFNTFVIIVIFIYIDIFPHTIATSPIFLNLDDEIVTRQKWVNCKLRTNFLTFKRKNDMLPYQSLIPQNKSWKEMMREKVVPIQKPFSLKSVEDKMRFYLFREKFQTIYIYICFLLALLILF